MRAHAADFVRDVRPVFESRCHECHGPRVQKSGLRLDLRAKALEGGGSGPVILPGNAEASLLIHHVERRDDVAPMPPKGDPLTADQIRLLREWIDQGAHWPDDDATEPADDPAARHWAWQPLAKPPVPALSDSAWISNEIDAFILAGLRAKGLTPSPEADRRTLLRRLTFDLHGLPPTPDQLDQFMNDPSSAAYERLVDRLLGSPRYGERWARHWLDVVHYGESHGFDKDKRRPHAWPYRDYVIAALNEDKPWPRFVEEQIAGDVLHPGDPQAVIATGFLAAGPWDFVGHAELREDTVEKNRVRALDRDDFVANTMTSFMSLTVQCARCHDHKFDPISQREYYGLQEVFAGIERGDREYEAAARNRIQAEWETRREGLNKRRLELETKAREAWPAELRALAERLDAARAERAGVGATPDAGTSPSNGYHSAIEGGADVMKWVRLDLGATMPVEGIVLFPAKPTDYSPDTPGFGFPVRFKVETAVMEDFSDALLVADQGSGDYRNPGDEPVDLAFEPRPARYVRVTATRLWPRTNDHVFALAEMQVYSEGKNVAAGAKVAALDSIESGRWGRANLVDGYTSRARISDDVMRRLADLRGETAELEKKVNEARETHLTPEVRAAIAELDEQIARVNARIESLPESRRVYAVLPREPREIHVLRRGDVASPGDRVFPGPLRLVGGLGADFGLDEGYTEGAARAALARWITHHDNMLTWRSIVNRVWGWHFGAGLVDTPNDFGMHGSVPVNAQLLDWLAGEFRDSGGSLKALHKLIVMSAAYRQVSAGRADCAAVDLDNRLLWRMNRRRLDAEATRDAVLAISGKLNLEAGGASFDLFDFKDDHSPHYTYEGFNDGPAEWRRSIYRTVIRSVPDPFMAAMDCADPNINMAARGETYTALQALALLNDPFILRQSRYLAERVVAHAADDAARANGLFVLALAREPSDDEKAIIGAYTAAHGWPAACRVILNSSEFLFVD